MSRQPAVPVKPAVDLLAKRKGGIRVGPQYQAEVPAAAPATTAAAAAAAAATDSSPGQEARWTPEHKLSEQQINQFVLLTRLEAPRGCDSVGLSLLDGFDCR